VLSLFDGISVAQLALNQLGVEIENYFASEIDPNPIKVTNFHFPETKHLGDVRNIKGEKLPEIDLMVFGFPCVDLSSLNKNRLGLDGEKSGLFFEALRIMEEVKPKYFLMENVGSMDGKNRDIISGLLGVKPIYINSKLVSAQNRKRIYWTNIPNIKAPKDQNIFLQDILENGFADRKKSNCILTKNVPLTKSGINRYLKKSIGQIVFLNQKNSESPKKENIRNLNLLDVDKENLKAFYRRATTLELERLQTLPIGYVGDILKKTPANHAIGNSFTLEVIKHLLSFASF